MLEELAPLFERGVLRPVPYRQTPPERLSETVRSFRKVAHVGKFVVSGAAGAVDLAPGMGGLKLRGDSTYLVSGGLTGFGLATARWLADGGARHLVLVGRRGAATAEAATALAELRAAGVEVEAVAADIADPAQVQELVIRLRRDHPPLRGIVHSAMVLSDAPLLDLTADQIRSVLAPKADGAWNLHRSTLDDPLDFFVCYSSMSALLGNRDQANYAAANEYVEALVRYRRAMGLPALVIGWGAIGATGYVARNQAIQDVFVRQGVYDLEPERAWTTIAHGLRTGASSLYAASVDWRTLRQFSRTVSASPCFSLVDGGQASHEGHAGNATAALADLAPNASPEERYRHLEQIMVREVCGVLGIDPLGLELDRPLQALGFDSLMAVELIVAVERATGHGLTRMSMLRPDVTTAELVAEVAGIVGTAPAAANGSRNAAAALPDAGDVRVEDLSDHEVDMLLRELETGEAGDE